MSGGKSRQLPWLAVVLVAALGLLRALAAGGSPAADGWAIPIRLATRLPAATNLALSYSLIWLSVFLLAMSAASMVRTAGAGPWTQGAAGLFAAALPTGLRTLPSLLAAAALSCLVAAMVRQAAERRPGTLLAILLWSQLLAILTPEWIWVAIGSGLLLGPLAASRRGEGAEATLAVVVAGGIWAAVLQAVLAGYLGAPSLAASGASAEVALAGVAGGAGLLLTIALVVLRPASYRACAPHATAGLVGVAGLGIALGPGGAGLAAAMCLPALAFQLTRGGHALAKAAL